MYIIARIYVCHLSRESQLLARSAGCSWTSKRRETISREANRRRWDGMNSWNDGEKRARERARGKRSWTVVPPPRRRMLRWGRSRGRKKKRWREISREVEEGTERRSESTRQRGRERDRPAQGARETAREGRGSLSRPARWDKDEADKRTDEGV